MVRLRLPFEDQIEVAESCIDDCLMTFSVGSPNDQDVIGFNICRMRRSVPHASTFKTGDHTKVNPIFVVELLYRLTDLSQDLHASFCGNFGVALDQSKEGALEVGEHQYTFFWVAISVYPKSIGAYEVRSKPLGQIVKLPGHALDNEGLVSGSWYDVSVWMCGTCVVQPTWP
jgi:hypothetical protein